MIWLPEEIVFPPYEFANEEGVLAFGGDLSAERLEFAYKNGIFPWFNEGEPIVWYAPPQRMVLFPDQVRVSKSMKQVLRKENFVITENKAFREVIFNCRHIDRNDQLGTWITDDMENAYINLHDKGIAKSIEVWQDDILVAGLYGIDLKNGVFCGESMFSKASNMSKVAFIHLAKNCGYKLIDCQVHNEHLESLGAREIDRSDFLKLL
ncbi:leucyl/phenylalanyl-tRNA--protein transferase [Tenacibaculum finnmarkense]|uniref:Leucyl/phenylalanyl-tRNA--protein transferase n=1 Tax=Tenacibaculum finnmarkense genomovar ulcerans TaxID=2781388 RepID=A0A2I2M8A3_9FLAO|nr:leucyl/phenylalanyl-tRNA--protein transferase [Tenacibaculum finnmarkense]ALU75580.1 leucyl/phenylalanyl-tRNA--protein transferase [Tenacibaculum dicentrarchi]MBE7632999.1 leucyl/phenylalanyl-tRNA--protein transferase [Tenacibaculum finnmarkense genomovar ulcerans]MBE7697046.1 leucyl/phenylalanyl-tRNA--protein transferase [Tenacibaculum finnmarkense genomovar ulcerans]MCD8428918.1 leucyl/phenylalanyl-tRNA--protein transferase [Tenacibaculum finnmarkense genomovar ulcerans]MCG8762397.1 leucy